jgi:hypothetical protein
MRTSQEETHVQRQGRLSSPPSPAPVNRRVPLKQLWADLPPEARHKTLRLLGDLILRNLREPMAAQEVKHDRR